jgi:hypothetical protein
MKYGLLSFSHEFAKQEKTTQFDAGSKTAITQSILPRGLRHRKKRAGVNFFVKAISAGLTNLPNQERF